MNRRAFIQTGLMGAGALTMNSLPLDVFGKTNPSRKNKGFTLLHTNDVHSRLDPFPNDGSKLAGKGGAAARYRLIESIRETGASVLLLDAGDMFQGTPYFNVYKGKPEIEVMRLMGYDAATLGNHDFDLGMENLAQQLQHAHFPIVNSNYTFSGTPLEHQVVPYHIVHKGGLKIGITGVGIALQGLVPDALWHGISYADPIQAMNRQAEFLKKRKRCDVVIVLSHLGFEYSTNQVSDKVLAAESEHVDWIIGGHTHTFLDKPVTIKNRKKQEVGINQAGWGGVQLGRIDIFFNHKNEPAYISKNEDVLTKETSA